MEQIMQYAWQELRNNTSKIFWDSLQFFVQKYDAQATKREAPLQFH